MDLRAVDNGNWEECAAIRPAPGQERFAASVAFYLCLCHYEQTWQPLAIYAAAEVVGHVMWAVDPDDGSYWIGGLVIDADRAAGAALIRDVAIRGWPRRPIPRSRHVACAVHAEYRGAA